MDWYCLLHEFQTLITGVLALAAALITAIVIWRSAKLPIEEERIKQKLQQEQHTKHVKILLLSDLNLVISNILKVQTSIYQIGPTKFNETYTLYLPEILSQWSDISLLDDDLLTNINVLRVMIMDYNLSAKSITTLEHSEKSALAKELEPIADFAKKIHERILAELKSILNAPSQEI